MFSCPRCQRRFDDGVRFCPVDGTQVEPVGQPRDRNIGRMLLHQFELREVCGRGAMGTVYLAYQHTMDRVVAVKVLRRELLQEPDVVRRFLREARAAAKLQHPNIVTVHLVGETEDGLPFIVMEYVDGVSLEAICEAQGPQPLARVINLGKQIATALGEAHHAGIVHRDLKPANILVTDRSRVADQVKVLDYGIAKIVEGIDSDQSVATKDGMIFGTPHYIAPEQATGGDIDRRADLYSLGVILFRLVTGRLPFEGTAGMQVVLKHLREQPPKPRELMPELPAGMEALILDLLAKDRALRPADAEAVMVALDAIAAAAPPSQPGITTTAKIKRPEVAKSKSKDAAAKSGGGAAAASGGAAAASSAGSRGAFGGASSSGRSGSVPVPVSGSGSGSGSVSVSGSVPVSVSVSVSGSVPVSDSVSDSDSGSDADSDSGSGSGSRAGGGSRGRSWFASTSGPRARSWWAGRRVLTSALVAVAAGAGVGVIAAWAHNRVEARRVTVGPPLGERRPAEPPRPPVLALFDEHDLKEDGLILRAGFERAPTAGEAASLILALTDRAGPIANAKIQITLDPPGQAKERVIPAAASDSGRFRAAFGFDTTGAHKLKVLAEVPGRPAPLELAFDVDARPAVQALPPSRAARGELRRRKPADDDDGPTVVVQPDPGPSVTPRRLNGPSAPPASSSSGPSSSSSGPSSPPREVDPPPRAHPPDPPPSDPPSSDDPTTLPPPAPSEP
jgi:eukaryotic-like serine/threonine-protein kinase